jgi:hypothetical protein
VRKAALLGEIGQLKRHDRALRQVDVKGDVCCGGEEKERESRNAMVKVKVEVKKEEVGVAISGAETEDRKKKKTHK